MRKGIKLKNSLILKQDLKYNNPKSDNTKIAKILLTEQLGFCTYTEEYFGAADLFEIDHFNPKLKNTVNDNYTNWYLVKALWNRRKSDKWIEPILHPTDNNFEKMVLYSDGLYLAYKSDISSINLIRLLDLNNDTLYQERKRWINRKKEEIKLLNESPMAFFTRLIKNDISNIRYLRAIETEFKFDIFSLIQKLSSNQ